MADQIPISEIFSVAKDITLTSALVYAMYAGAKRKWYWAHTVADMQAMYERMLKEKVEQIAFWQHFSARQANVTETTVTKVADLVTKLPAKGEPS